MKRKFSQLTSGPKTLKPMTRMREYWPADRIKNLLHIYPADHRDVPTLKQNLQKEHATKTYRNGAGMDFGRLFAKYSYQSLTKESRDYLLQDTGRHDIDADNCFPTIMLQVFKQHGIDTPYLEDYVKTRPDIIRAICQEFDWLDRSDVKIAYIVALHNGDYVKNATDVEIEALNAFRTELKRASKSLFKLPQYKPMYLKALVQCKATLTGKKKRNPIGTTISWICQVEETKIGAAVCKYMTDQGYVIETNMFDGFIVQGADDPPLGKDLSRFVFEHTGRQMSFSEKPIERTALKDLEYKAPSLPDLSKPTDRLVLFDLNGTLAHRSGTRWAFRNGITGIKTLQDSGTKVGLFTNKSRKKIPLDVLQRAIGGEGFKFDCVLAGEECYKGRTQNKHDRLKSVDLYFKGDADKVCIIDDTPDKIPKHERHRLIKISTWEGDKGKDTELLDCITMASTFDPVAQSVQRGWHKDVLVTEHQALDRVLPFKLDAFRKVLCVKAGMSMGKTYQTRKLIAKLDPKRILCISTRISLSRSQEGVLSGLGFQHYSEGTCGNRLIMQYESLHKLEGSEPFDLVIMDECRSLCDNMTSVFTNEANLRINATLLKLFAQAATRVLCLDADLEVDGAVRHLTEALFRPFEIQVVRYKHNRMTKKFVGTTSEDAWMLRLSTALKLGEKCAVCCQSKQRALDLAERFKEYRSKVYTKDTDDKDILELRDINKALQDVQLCIMTSKVTVGADHTDAWGQVFVEAGGSGRGCTARNLLQMVGRFRNTDSNTVHTLFSPFGTDEEHDDVFETAMDYLLEKKRHMELFRDLLSFDPEFEGTEMKFAPDWITEMFAHTDAEQNQSFKFEFKRLCKLKDFTVTMLDEGEQVAKDLLEASMAVNASDIEFEKDIHRRLCESDLSEVINLGQHKITRQEATKTIRSMVSGAHVMKHWPDAKLNFEDFTTAKKHMAQIQNICAETRLTTADLLRIDLNRIKGKQTNGEIKVPWADVSVKPRLAVHKAVDDCLQLLGFDTRSALDTETIVSADKVEENSTAILKLCRASSIARGVRFRTATPTAALRRELKEVFAVHLVKVRTREGNDVKVVRYHLEKDQVVHHLAHSSDFYTKKDLEAVNDEMMDKIWHLMCMGDSVVSFEEASRDPAVTAVVEEYGLDVCRKTWRGFAVNCC